MLSPLLGENASWQMAPGKLILKARCISHRPNKGQKQCLVTLRWTKYLKIPENFSRPQSPGCTGLFKANSSASFAWSFPGRELRKNSGLLRQRDKLLIVDAANQTTVWLLRHLCSTPDPVLKARNHIGIAAASGLPRALQLIYEHLPVSVIKGHKWRPPCPHTWNYCSTFNRFNHSTRGILIFVGSLPEPHRLPALGPAASARLTNLVVGHVQDTSFNGIHCLFFPENNAGWC